MHSFVQSRLQTPEGQGQGQGQGQDLSLSAIVMRGKREREREARSELPEMATSLATLSLSRAHLLSYPVLHDHGQIVRDHGLRVYDTDGVRSTLP